MKRSFYTFSFIVLGVLLQQVIHAILEIWYIGLLVNNFATYGFGLSWHTWFTIHAVYSIVLFIAGAVWGYSMGKKFWPKLYDKNGSVRHPRPWRI